MPELFDRREIGLPPAGVKANELIRKHVHTRGFDLVYTPALRMGKQSQENKRADWLKIVFL